MSRLVLDWAYKCCGGTLGKVIVAIFTVFVDPLNLG